MEADPVIYQTNLTYQEIKDIEQLAKDGYIRKSNHPTLPLSIYNYSTKTQFEQNWTPTTMMCRGLVLDNHYDIIIRPPKKFFNQGEELAAPVDLLDARISEKLDGYMIMVKADTEWGLIIASRGSFSNQYIDATKKFITDEVLLKLVPNYTYFCELLQNFPGDEAIILTKHPIPKLVCWAIRDENFNEIIPDEECPFPIAKELSLAEAKQYLKQRVEGVVAQDLTTKERVKIKTEYFIEHHRLLSDCTKKRVWEILSNGQRVEDLDIPDEFMKSMNKWQDDLLYDHRLIMYTVEQEAEKRETLTDKQVALDEELSPEMKAFIFTLRKKGLTALSNQIWQKLKPRNVV